MRTRDRTVAPWVYRRGTVVRAWEDQDGEPDSVEVRLDGQALPATFWAYDCEPLSIVDRIGEIEVGPGP